MPNPQEVASVTINGQPYAYWKTIECTKIFGTGVCDAKLTAAEMTTGTAGLPTIKAKPGDAAKVSLAGTIVIDGFVWLRQAAVDAESHGVQIGIASPMLDAVVGSVADKPGQYQNYTLQQIASAVLSKVGATFQIIGNPAGADKPFPRISPHVGESRFSFIERMCRLRNLHLVEDGKGNLTGFRSPTEGTAATITDSQIKRARVILRNDEMMDTLVAVAQFYGGDQASADQLRDSAAKATIPNSTRNRTCIVEIGHPCDQQDVVMAANQVRDHALAMFMDATITVRGWFAPDGTLWWGHVANSTITLQSPTLLPVPSLSLQLKGVVHRQSDSTGTETDLVLSNILGTDQLSPQDLYGGGWSDPTALGPAQPAPPDTQQ